LTLITTQEAAELRGLTKSAILKAVASKKYQSCYVKGKGQGGKQLRIALESLPQEAQDKHYGIQRQKASDVYWHLTEDQRQLTAFKHCRVLEYKKFKSEYPKADKMVAFLKQYNEANPANKPLTKRQLNHWEKLYDRDGLKGLVDRRGGHNKGETTISDDVWDYFKALWLKESRPSAQSCYDMTSHYFNDIDIPHISAFLRQIEKIPEPAKIFYREGKKAYQDKCEPFIIRDYSKMYSNQLWVADNHLFDVKVVDKNGNVFRAWLTGWEDIYSRFVVGYTVNKISPNSDIVLDSFARSCLINGIPTGVLTDNGKDYTVYDVFNKDFPMSVCNEMNIEVTRALPYNAKAKPVERLFKTLEEKYCKHLPAYIGNKPENRPEKMSKPNKKLVNQSMPYNEFIEFVENMMKTYNTTPHSSLDGKTPLEAYKGGFGVPMRTVQNEDMLNMFLMRTTKPLKVGRNGIFIKAIGHYYDDERLLQYRNKGASKVYARYNSEDVRTVYIFSEEREFICKAASVELSDYSKPVPMESIRELQRKKKARKKAVREQMPDIDVLSVSEYVEQKASRYENIMSDNNVIQMNPVIHQQAKAINKEEKRLDTQNKASKRKTKEREDALYKLFQ